MRRHIQAFKLNLTYTVVEGDAQGLGALGRVLGHIAGHLLSRQLLVVVASLGDVANVELLAPAGGQSHALVLVDHRAGHGHGARGLPDGPLEEVGGEPAWWGRRTGRAAAGGGRVQADDGVEVDRARFWYSATFANEIRTSRRSSPSLRPASCASARYR
jgi:hypothetical protein